ncbi:MAG: hypothetical protein J4478_02430 [Candidatus Diapherotrites archaeon]|uniref:RNA-binding protein n=1 Tax=Candidatus Iainarchaeum sp. TaxID=3101447 RepID=A0A7J4KV24_9ARCH|nr:MAG: exosome complex component RRP4 [archaeon GW2011_AR21]MBS3058236.1 hypothetical protein [Candidatus Diapherotrites archaeon]HIH21904.1 hypothetical protein [Candidatus Diapherotrites archaeon]HIH33544.1 hypothetical protein [Candidatus Diapherotrites archaeon]
MKKIVVPGELLTAERKRPGEHVFMQNGKLYSDVIGILDDKPGDVSVIALEGRYVPRMDDVIVGVVGSEKATGFMVDLNSFTQSFVSKKDIREQLKPGYIISARVLDVNELKEAELGQIRVFYGGEIISISPVKVPRVIGKNASMLDVLKRGTNSTILVGRNGWIWAKGGNVQLLIKLVEKIEREAHLENLTVKVQDFVANANKSVKPQAFAENPALEERKAVEKLDKELKGMVLNNESDSNGS